MGDIPRSAIVARMALDAVGELFLAPWAARPRTERPVGEAAERLRLGLVQAHGRLYAPGRSRENRIGTTFAGVVACGESICAAHVGDSRVYLLRRSKARLARLTADHTVAGDALGRGVSRDAAAALPGAHALTRMLGVARGGNVEPMRLRWEAGDVALLCTDGVSDHVETEELASILLEVTDLDDAARRIVARASAAGAWDNATALLVRKPG